MCKHVKQRHGPFRHGPFSIIQHNALQYNTIFLPSLSRFAQRMFHDTKYTHLHIHGNHKVLLPNSKLLHKECFMMSSTLIYTCMAVIKLYYQIQSYSQGMCHDTKYTHLYIHGSHKALLPNSKLLHKECFMMPGTLTHSRQS